MSHHYISINDQLHHSDFVEEYEEVLKTNTVKPKKAANLRKVVLALYLVAFPFLAFFVGFLLSKNIDNTFFFDAEETDSSPVISIGNEYGEADDFSSTYPWKYIVEPYRVSYLAVRNPSSDVLYRWLVDGWEIDYGSNVSVSIPGPAGEYHNITLQTLDSSSRAVLTEVTEVVIIKYVRREIRSLLSQDRTAFLQAVSITQRVPTITGQLLYGDEYYSKDYFNRIHLYFGATRDCDHFHEGPAFVVIHMAISLLFERTLQSINPSVSLPYWDYSLESTFFDPADFRSSWIFSDDIFSEANTSISNSKEDDGVVRHGRFAYSSVMKNAHNYSDFVSPYGLLRSPWDSNPWPYLTRSTRIANLENNLKPVGCSTFADTLAMYDTDYVTLALSLNTDAHGHIHELLGGSWRMQNTLITEGDNDSIRAAGYLFAHSLEKYSKFLWRKEFLNCPSPTTNSTVASVCHIFSDKTAEEYSALARNPVCRCQCVIELYNGDTMKIAETMYDAGILESLTFQDPRDGKPIINFLNAAQTGPAMPIDGYSEAQSAEIYESLRDYVCDVGVIGDMYQATSSNDIVFWVLHPTIERLWHVLRLNQYNGLTPNFDENWPTYNVSASCVGHAYNDPTFLSGLFSSSTSTDVYTNGELYALLHPATDSLPYIYDHLRWSHCEALGYDMKGY